MGGEGAETAGGRVVGAIAATRGSEGGAGPASAVLPDDRHLPQQRSVYLQMCDLKGEEIKALVHEAPPPTSSVCDKRNGWYDEATIQRMRNAVKDTMIRMVRERPPGAVAPDSVATSGHLAADDPDAGEEAEAEAEPADEEERLAARANLVATAAAEAAAAARSVAAAAAVAADMVATDALATTDGAVAGMAADMTREELGGGLALEAFGIFGDDDEDELEEDGDRAEDDEYASDGEDGMEIGAEVGGQSGNPSGGVGADFSDDDGDDEDELQFREEGEGEAEVWGEE